MGDQPDWTENPFSAGGGGSADDPFADPSITGASTTVPEYNPFEGDKKAGGGDAPAWASNQPTPAAAPTPAQQQQAEPQEAPQWATKAAEKPAKKAKEPKNKMTKEEAKRLRDYEENVEAAEDPRLKDPNYRPVNWPPFPENCRWPCKPCFHHDFVGEIPDWGYRVTKRVYQMWLLYFVCLFWNFICILASLDCDDCEGQGASVGLAIAFLFLFAPLSYLCWFQPLYQAMRKDSSLRFAWFFLSFTFQSLMGVFFTVGFQGSGASGFIVALVAISHKDSAIVGILMLTAAILWLLFSILAFVMVNRVLLVYRSSGQSLQKAQGEAISGAVNSKAGRSAAKQAVKSAF